MFYSAPIALMLIAPWAAVVAWLLIGRPRAAAVPFLHLWPRNVTTARIRSRAIRPPSIALALIFLATLLALFAAAKPLWSRAPAHPLTIVVDQGPTMRGEGAAKLIADLQSKYQAGGSDGPIRWIAVPGNSNHAALLAAVENAQRDAIGPIALVTNQPIETAAQWTDVTILSPPTENAGIVGAAARSRPHGQVMVRLRNQSGRATARLLVRCGQVIADRTIELPPKNESRNYFCDLDLAQPVVFVHLDLPDDISADNDGWLVAECSSPRLIARGPLDENLARMIDIYSRHRPASEGATTVLVVQTSLPLNDLNQAVISAPAGSHAPLAPGPVKTIDHPIARSVSNWNAILADAAVAALPAKAGWTPIVSAGGMTIVAVREQPARQVWVGFDSPTFPTRVEFPILWTAIFDWLGHTGDDLWKTGRARSVPASWTRVAAADESSTEPDTGVFRDSAGNLHAQSCIDLPVGPNATADRLTAAFQEFAQRVKAAPAVPGATAMKLSPMLILAALVLLAVAMVAWETKAPRQRPQSAERPAVPQPGFA